MRSSTTLLSSTLIAAIFGSTLLTGCGGNAEPAPAASADTAPARTAATPASPRDPAAPSLQDSRPSGASPGSIFDTPGSPADIAKAREVLVEVGRTYRSAPTLSDTLALSSEGAPPQIMRLRFDRGNSRIEMAMPSNAAVFIDGRLHMTNELLDDLHLEIEVEDPALALAQHFNWVPPYHFAMRFGGDLTDELAADSYLPGMGLGILRNPRLRGYTPFTDDDGREFHRITIESGASMGHVFVDAESMLIKRITMRILPGPGQPAHTPPTEMLVEANPVLAEDLETPIVFDPGDRERITDPQAMTVLTLTVGDRAPNYRFKTPDGETIRLADLRGYAVVIDFWATWCVPCIQGLPHLNRFHRWADEENQPVKVFAVNTLEQHETFDERREAVERFWGEREFDVPLVYDEKSRLVQRTGYANVPLLLVIDPNGRITSVKDHFNRNMYQILKADVERALRSAQDAPADDDVE